MIDGGLRQIFRDDLPAPADWQSIETGGTGKGVPDSNVCLNGHERWIEFKRAKGWVVPIKPEQVAWHLRRERHGGMTFIAVRRFGLEGRASRKKGSVLTPRALLRPGEVDELWMYRGHQAIEVADLGLRAEPVACFSGGPSAWPWAAIRNILVDGRT